MTPTFYTFREREKLMDIVELITGGRLHPCWFRIGGLAADLPEGWKEAVDDFVRIFPDRLKEYEALITKNPIFKARTQGIGRLSLRDAMEWGVTGPNLRACGLEWDLRKKFPYSGYENFQVRHSHGQTEETVMPATSSGWRRCGRACRIIEQAANQMPGGRLSRRRTTAMSIPEKEDTLRDIESLIHHFINVTRGPKIPKGRGLYSDGDRAGRAGILCGQ